MRWCALIAGRDSGLADKVEFDGTPTTPLDEEEDGIVAELQAQIQGLVAQVLAAEALPPKLGQLCCSHDSFNRTVLLFDSLRPSAAAAAVLRPCSCKKLRSGACWWRLKCGRRWPRRWSRCAPS